MSILKKCIFQAKQLEDSLFPVDCLEILKANYGLRLELMNPGTIHRFINILMNTLTEVEQEQIVEVVNDYLNEGV